MARKGLFQSAPPVKGATHATRAQSLDLVVSIRAPREGGDPPPMSNLAATGVSIRAPREGGDGHGEFIADGFNRFNPRPP